MDMEIARTGYGYGVVRFSWADIGAFCGELPRWKRRALREMETVWLSHKNKPADAERDEPKIGRKFSLNLLDAWF